MVKMTKATRTAEIAKAREVDTKIAAEWDKFWAVEDKARQMDREAASAQKMVDYYYNRPDSAAYYVNKVNLKRAAADAFRVEAKPLREAAIQMDKDLYEGWNRFFLVKHIHSSQHCSSFRPTTKVGWLPDVSGLTEAEAVAAHGETLCTICYPSAPVALTTKQADPNTCAGSGKSPSPEHRTGREHHTYGRAGYCGVCLRWTTMTANGVMRKHKADDTTKRHALGK